MSLKVALFFLISAEFYGTHSSIKITQLPHTCKQKYCTNFIILTLCVLGNHDFCLCYDI